MLAVAAAVAVVWLWVASGVRMAAPFRADIDVRYGAGPTGLGTVYTVALLLVLIGAVGLRLSGERAVQRHDLIARAGAVEQESAVVAERARLARDLHGVVAHHVSLIAVRAETAPSTHPDLDDGACDLLAEIAGDARLALDELRGVLGILGRAGQSARSPQPGWRDIPALVTRSREAGTTLAVEGDLDADVAPALATWPRPSVAGYASARPTGSSAWRRPCRGWRRGDQRGRRRRPAGDLRWIRGLARRPARSGVVGTAADGVELVELVARTRPDAAVVDVRMPRLDGIEATRLLTRRHPTRVLVLTTFDLDQYVFDALRAGASGFLLKDVTAQRLVEGVRLVAEGSMLLGPAVTRRLVEREVLLLRALRLRDRVQAVVWAYEHGLVRPGS